jgi:hypothetical protein
MTDTKDKLQKERKPILNVNEREFTQVQRAKAK